MKYRKLLLSILIFVSIFTIYIMNVDKKINYIALGDSLAAGQNPYGEISYSYADYVSNYLERNNLLKFYTKGFAASGDRIKDLLEDIKVNKEIMVDNRSIRLKAALRESDLVTVSIGANDFLSHFNLQTLDMELLEEEKLLRYVDQLKKELDDALAELKKYAKKEVLVIGYYDPLPRMTESYQNKMDTLFSYADQTYEALCQKHKITYISMYHQFKSHKDYLPNPLDIHPSSEGYQKIASEIIDHLEKNVLN